MYVEDQQEKCGVQQEIDQSVIIAQ